jgi:hypothetical protein
MKRSDAAAFAGIVQNPNVSVSDRTAVLSQLLDLYVEQLQEMQDLLSYLESKNPADEDGDSMPGYYESQYEGPAYADAAAKLRRILDGE